MRRLFITAILTLGFWVLCLLFAPGAAAEPKPGPKARTAQSTKAKALSLGPMDVKRFPGMNDVADATADWRIVNPAYFAAVNLPILRGRNFAAAETREAPRVALVDENLAQKLWPGQDAVGRRLRVEGEESPWMTVIGVVRHHAGGALESSTHGQLYFPYPESTTTTSSDQDE